MNQEQQLAEAIQQYLSAHGTEKTIEIIGRKLFALTLAHNEQQENNNGYSRSDD